LRKLGIPVEHAPHVSLTFNNKWLFSAIYHFIPE
jgi:hypothetical protein